jgi:hypothetical protein
MRQEIWCRVRREMISDLRFQISDSPFYFRFEIDLRSEI